MPEGRGGSKPAPSPEPPLAGSLTAVAKRGSPLRSENEETWTVGSFVARAPLIHQGDPLHPSGVVWMDSRRLVLGFELADGPLDADTLLASFGEVTRAPMVGPPRAPRRIRTAEPILAAWLAAGLGERVELEHGGTPELDHLMAGLREHLDAVPHLGPPSYLDGELDPALMTRLFDVFARLHDAAPWSAMLAADAVFSLGIDALGLVDLAVDVVGTGALFPGLAIFPDAAALRELCGAATLSDRGEAPEHVPAHVYLRFVPPHELLPELVEEVARRGWTLASPTTYPDFGAVDDDGTERPPTPRELLILEAACEALTRAAQTERGKLEKAFRPGAVGYARVFEIGTHEGPLETTILVPHPEFVSLP